MPVYKKLEGELKKELNNLVVESVIYLSMFIIILKFLKSILLFYLR